MIASLIRKIINNYLEEAPQEKSLLDDVGYDFNLMSTEYR